MASSTTVLEARDLGYAYAPERFAIRHLNLHLERGEVLGLLGRNGAGKTTTVRLLTTLLRPTEGTAMILGYDVRTGGRALRSRLGVVLQAESLDFVSVEQNLTLYAFLWGVARETAKARAEEMLELFELGHVRRRKPWALSGGERRRFQVARELMHVMEILFLDEPTVGLDAIARRRILRYLRDRSRAGLSIVFTTHILHEADLLCDRIAVLHQGVLRALDTAEALKRTYGGAREVTVSFAAPLDAADRLALEGELRRRQATILIAEPDTAEPGKRLGFRAENVEDFFPWISGWAHRPELRIERLAIEEPTLEGAFLGLIGGDGDPATGADPAREPPAMASRGGAP
jgi:ABC-2 type transport system ATP-binding protein